MGIAVRSRPISSVICTRHPDCSEGLEQFTLHFALCSFRERGGQLKNALNLNIPWTNTPDRTYLSGHTWPSTPWTLSLIFPSKVP